VRRERARWRIGIDFDNTLVRYDAIFALAARERGLVSGALPATKLQVRDMLRRAGREAAWTELQGHVYGVRMEEAEAFPEAIEVLRELRDRGHEIFIVSHRTRHPALGPAYDLHQAARDWMARHLHGGDAAVDAAHIYLETTREDKILRIRDLRCDVFVDDLPEVLVAAGFPPTTRRILFDPDGRHVPPDGVERARSWAEVSDLIGEGA
jgi:deoxypyrimidine-specific 5' nucleotidase type C protein (NT5C)